MILVVAPEPAPWLATIIEAAQAAAGPAGVQVLAPWATAGPLPAWIPLPARLRAFWQRRALPTGVRAPVPGWLLGEGALRAWAGTRTDRTLRARFALRALVDHLAARWISGHGAAISAVVAPSCAAWRSFAAAARRGARTFLLEDLPGIRALHADLDRAARAHPRCAFLHRFRASRGVIVRQEAERALAGHVIVRGRHARAQHTSAGREAARILELVLPASIPGSAQPADRAPPGPDSRIFLAGLAAARHGTNEALAAIEARPHITLLVRPGEGMEPADLLAHPRVAACTEAERRRLHGVRAVIAPTWCEAYTGEVAAAAAAGVPVIATQRGAGFATLAAEIPPGDARALGSALDRVLATPGASGPADDMESRARASLTRLAAAFAA